MNENITPDNNLVNAIMAPIGCNASCDVPCMVHGYSEEGLDAAVARLDAKMVAAGVIRPEALPYPDDPGQTHYEGCWKYRGHAACAAERAEQMERERDEAKERAEQNNLDLIHSRTILNTDETGVDARLKEERARAARKAVQEP